MWTRHAERLMMRSLRKSRSSFSSSYEGGDHLDRQIHELNQELEGILGPSCDHITAKSPSLPAQVNDRRILSDLHEQSPNETQGRSVHGNYSFGREGSNLDKLSHVDAYGKACMVDVSQKAYSKRIAVASGRVVLGRTAFALVSANQIAKGDVLAVAKIAGIYGAKQTGNLIPLCHNIALSNVEVSLELDEEENSVIITAHVTAVGATGVEMEALTAVSVAALTVYDMCKAVSKHVRISNIQLESKTGGKGGDWCRNKD